MSRRNNNNKPSARGNKGNNCKDSRKPSRGKDTISKDQSSLGPVMSSENWTPNNIPKDNDEAWYNNDGLLNLAGKLTFANALGDRVDLSSGDFARLNDLHFPGILILDLYSGVGYSSDNTSAVNVAAQEMYTKVRSVQSAAAKYGKQDLMMYYLMIQQARNMYWYGVRTLGMSNFVNKLNRYMPNYLEAATGIHISDISKQASRFANILNFYAKQIAGYAIPANFDFAKRQNFQYSNWFVDDTSPKAKLYIPRPAGYFTYALDSNGAGMLKWHNIDYSQPLGVAGFEKILDEIIASFVGDEDLGNMSGDIQKTFPSSTVGWEPIDEKITIPPIYNYNMLLAIHNATAIGEVINGDITQDPSINQDTIICKPTFNTTKLLLDEGYAPILGKRLMDVFGGVEPTPGIVAEASRYMVIPVKGPNSTLTLDGASPIDIPTKITTVSLQHDAQGKLVPVTYVSYYQTEFNADSASSIQSDWADFAYDWTRNAVNSQFTAAPLTMHVISSSTGSTLDSVAVHLFNKVTNYSIVDAQFLRDLQKVCTLSLFSTKNL